MLTTTPQARPMQWPVSQMRKLATSVWHLSFEAIACSAAAIGCGNSNPSQSQSSGTVVDAGDHLDGSVLADGGAADSADEPSIPCDNAMPCPGSLACCSSTCADTTRDPRNCGACGVACGPTAFCATSACRPALFDSLCANPQATVVLDGFQADNQAGVAFGDALTAGCNPPTAVQRVSQQAAGVLAMDADAGRPATGGGNTFIAGGGEYGQLGVRYLDDQALTPVYLATDGVTAQIIDRLTGAALANTSVSALDAHHDFFFIELVVEPKSGTACLIGAGILAPGTAAAGYYGATQLVPNHTGDSHSFYVVEWTDSNNDSVPNAGDAFDVKASR
jgi:hypothetical protein